jgi:hypothetical protein
MAIGTACFVQLAVGCVIATVGPSFKFSSGCSAVARTSAGVYTVTLAMAIPNINHAMAVVSVVTDGVTARATGGFVDTTTLEIRVFDSSNAAHDGGVIGFVVYALDQ